MSRQPRIERPINATNFVNSFDYHRARPNQPQRMMSDQELETKFEAFINRYESELVFLLVEYP